MDHTTNTKNDKSRAEFEAALLEIDPNCPLKRWPSGDYMNRAVDGHWRGWQMALARQSAALSAVEATKGQQKPMAWVLKTGHGDRYTDKHPTGEFADKWIPLYRAATHKAVVSPDAAIAAQPKDTTDTRRDA